MGSDFVSWGGGGDKPTRRRWLLAASVIAVPVLLVGIAATTRAVLDMDLWRHNSQRARDLLASPGGSAKSCAEAATALQLDVLSTFDAIQHVALEQSERGDIARAVLQNLRERLR